MTRNLFVLLVYKIIEANSLTNSRHRAAGQLTEIIQTEETAFRGERFVSLLR